MSQMARDLIELRKECPMSPELRGMALNIIAVGVASIHGGC